MFNYICKDPVKKALFLTILSFGRSEMQILIYNKIRFIVTFRVCKTHPMAEYLKLEFIKEIGQQHMKIVQGTSSLLQMAGLVARLCEKNQA